MVEISSPVLKDAKALVVGVANEHSIAYGCAKAFHEVGADLALTYLNEKAKPHVEPLAAELNASIFMPLDVVDDNQLAALFETIKEQWSQLDILVHSIAFAPKDDLQGGLLNEAVERAPVGELVDIMDVGYHCAFPATLYGRRVTGGVVYVDGGINTMA